MRFGHWIADDEGIEFQGGGTHFIHWMDLLEEGIPSFVKDLRKERWFTLDVETAFIEKMQEVDFYE